MKFKASVLLFTSLAYPVLSANFNVVVNGTASHSIPSTLYGWMFEDISNSGDGGLYAEMLQNRAFQQVTPGTNSALAAWSSVNGAKLSVVNNTSSLSSALPNSLQVAVPSGASGAVGVANSGYFGIKVDQSWTYNASFFYKIPSGSSLSGTFTISLKSSTGTTLATTTAPINSSATSWTQVFVRLKPTSSTSSPNNVFTVTVDGPTNQGKTVFFSLFSLFPPTFKNRENGLRMDIAQLLSDPRPAIFRFPGGNNLEGQTIATRWQWRNTVGPLTARPGRPGDWGYINTDGLGLKEYLDFIEDTGMQSIMAVWSGFALGGQVASESSLAQFIQEAADQINFVIGDPAKSSAAALRAQLGHPEPYTLNFVEIGNEDFFNADSYASYRWHDFVGNLSAQFPNIKFLATTNIGNPVLTPKPQAYDSHNYQTPTWFAQNSFMYDDIKRDGTTYFEGEYAAISTNSSNVFGSPSTGRLQFPTMASSTGEAAFMIGFERNADIVFAASYAPLLNHLNNTAWTPNLISFDSQNVIPSTSYHVQKMFSLNKGDVFLPSTLPSRTGTVFWSITRNTTSNDVLIKISNTNGTAADMTFTLPFNNVASMGTAQVLSGSQTTSNTPAQPNAAVPQTHTINTGKTFTYTAPGFSVNVLTVRAS